MKTLSAVFFSSLALQNLKKHLTMGTQNIKLCVMVTTYKFMLHVLNRCTTYLLLLLIFLTSVSLEALPALLQWLLLNTFYCAVSLQCKTQLHLIIIINYGKISAQLHTNA